MNITKFGHACLVVEQSGQKIIIDPGVYSHDLNDMSHVSAVVVTHAHGDHLDDSLLADILDENPTALVFGPQEVSDALPETSVMVVSDGDTETVGVFELRFFGAKHADIYKGKPGSQNVGVLINELFYYPGDSFDSPDVPVELLAVPISGPWLKIGESAAFIDAVKPARCFPTHEAFLSDIGLESTNDWLSNIVGAYSSYIPLHNGEHIDVEV